MAVITAAEVRDAIGFAYSGRKLSAAAQLTEAERLLPVARAIVARSTAPDAPEAIGNEAIIRICGYFAEARFGGFVSESDEGTAREPCGGVPKLRRASISLTLEKATGGARLMRWPWEKRTEHRASATDALVAQILSAAQGSTTGDWRTLSQRLNRR